MVLTISDPALAPIDSNGGLQINGPTMKCG